MIDVLIKRVSVADNAPLRLSVSLNIIYLYYDTFKQSIAKIKKN
jgi:hypothetical protein